MFMSIRTYMELEKFNESTMRVNSDLKEKLSVHCTTGYNGIEKKLCFDLFFV